jgi:hypothetical protein
MGANFKNAKNLLEQVLRMIDELKQVKAEAQSTKKPLSQKDYEMHYRAIAKAIQDERRIYDPLTELTSYEPVDIALVSFDDREQVPSMVIRVRDAWSDTLLSVQMFERGNEKGHYRLSPLGVQFYTN